MATRTNHPNGVPCWVDLWTSDVAGSRHFYTELFGWTVTDPEPAFGGYFTFLRNGERVAGAMGDMGEPGSDFFMPATNTWKPYLSVDDIRATVGASVQAGAEVLSDAMAVADLGQQAVLVDPAGAQIGFWQPGTMAGFTVIDEPGAPSWFEVHTRSYDQAVGFYRDVLGLVAESMGDTDEFRYTTLNGPSECGQVAGIMDATAWLPDGAANTWTIYWCTDNTDASVAQVEALGGTVIQPAEDTPYGRIATVADPAGAVFRLRTPPTE